MSFRICGAIFTALLGSSAWGQPVVGQVQHAATNRLDRFVYSGIAQGSLAIAKGSQLGPAGLQQAASYPLQKTLAGTSVTITSGGTTFDGLMVYTVDRQIAFIVPSATPLGSAQVRVIYNGRASAPVTANIVRSNLGVYTWTQTGNGPGIATDALTGALITVQTPAHPDQFLTVYSDGLGAVTGDETQPPPARDFGGDLVAWVGTQQAEITYRGRVPCCTGFDQINLKVPANSPASCYVPMYFQSASGGYTSNITTIPITNDGLPCPDPLGYPSLNVVGKDHIVLGLMLQERNFNREANGSITSGDFAHMGYARIDQPYYNNADSQGTEGVVAPGTCAVNQLDYNSRFDPLNEILLDAGLIRLAIGSSTFNFPRGDFGDYGAFFQGTSPLNFSGSGTISNGAGAQVPAFSVSHTTPPLPNFQWIEQGSLSAFQAGDPVTLSWTGSDPDGFVYISGGSTNSDFNMVFRCRVAGSQNSFTIPGAITRFIPAGSGFFEVTYRRPVPVTGLPAGFDALRYERQVVRSRSLDVR